MSGLLETLSQRHSAEGESLLHRQAKTQIKNFIARDNPIHTIETEYPVKPDKPGDPTPITDIFVRTRQGQKVAIEIQCSLQSTTKFQDRTEAYSDRGIHVLWLIAERTYLPQKTTADGAITGTAFKDATRWLQRHYFGRVYAFNRYTLENPDIPAILPHRLEALQRHRIGFDPASQEEFGYTQYYDTIAEATTGTLPAYRLLTTTSNGLRLARFYDKAWWTGDSR